MIKDHTKEKTIGLAKASALSIEYKKSGKKVGCLSGSFDLLTARHYRSLYECARLCDVLIVLLNSDSSIRAYKGPGKPFLAQGERSYLVSQSAYVAHVVLFDELTPIVALDKIKPDIFFNTAQWGNDCIEKNVVEKHGGRIKAFDIKLEPDWVASSTEVVGKVRASEALQVQRAVFLDRDGVINDNKKGYTYLWKDFTFMPYVISSLKKLQKAGYLLFIITNQSGIGRGYYTSKDVVNLHKKVVAYLREHGVQLSGIYYCPHTPEDSCTCRKPSPGMLLKAAHEHSLNLSKSWLVGDSGSDIDAGRLANTQTILTGSANKETGEYKPSVVVDTIKEAADHILAHSK